MVGKRRQRLDEQRCQYAKAKADDAFRQSCRRGLPVAKAGDQPLQPPGTVELCRLLAFQPLGQSLPQHGLPGVVCRRRVGLVLTGLPAKHPVRAIWQIAVEEFGQTQAEGGDGDHGEQKRHHHRRQDRP